MRSFGRYAIYYNCTHIVCMSRSDQLTVRLHRRSAGMRKQHIAPLSSLKTLRLEGFRSFHDYKLEDFARVNVLVGPNNCGKTSILEAAHILISRGHPHVLLNIARRRGEEGNFVGESERETPVITHFFYDHQLTENTSFSLFGENHGEIVAKLQLPDENREGWNHYGDPDFPVAFEFTIGTGDRKDHPVFWISQFGEAIGASSIRMRRLWREISSKSTRVQFIAPDSIGASDTRNMWDTVQREGQEREVVEALKILVCDLESIHFLTADRSTNSSNRAGILVGMTSKDSRTPLGSCGDGMRRLLALSLSLIQVSHGCLLVDEIDAGFHWSVMKDMWRLVVETARRLQIQVFATTHSFDCIRGLAAYAESKKDAGEVAMYKIDRSLKEAVRIDAEGLQYMVKNEIEMR